MHHLPVNRIATGTRPALRGAAAVVLLGLVALGNLPGTEARAQALAEQAPLVVAARSPVRELVPSPGRATIELVPVSQDEDVLSTLELERGKSVRVRTSYAVKRVSVGDPKVLEVVVLSPRELQLVPTQVGDTNIVIWDAQGEPQAAIDVHVGTSHAKMERQLRRALGVEEIHVEGAGPAVVLRGTVPSPVAAERAVAMASAYFEKDAEKRVVNMLEVGGNQQVMIEVIIAEMSRNATRRLTSNLATAIQSGDQTFQFFNFLDSLARLDEDLSTAQALLLTDRVGLIGQFVDEDFALTALFEVFNEDGLAKILAQPTLLARSGQAASFLAGGEVPIPVSQGGAFGSITIEFKQFGVGVQFTPTVLGPDRIHLQVAPEVSEPDFTLGISVGGQTTPGFITRRASTAVELGDGQSFAIAGLLDERVRESIKKYPLLGDIPILGALFRSSQFQKDETELVLIVTPRLVKPLPPGPHPLPTDSFIEPNDFEFYLLGALESQRGLAGAAGSGAAGGLIGPAGHRVPAEVERSTP